MMRWRKLWLPALLVPAACAQFLQNSDISILVGAQRGSEWAVPGVPSARARAEADRVLITNYGYQLARSSAGSVWLSWTILNGPYDHATAPGVGGYVAQNPQSYTLGLRFMVPLNDRLSVYGLAEGGGAMYQYPVVLLNPRPYLTGNSVWRGIAHVGGGVDVRLFRYLSLRGEVREMISGHGFQGPDGRTRFVPAGGIAFHC